MQSVALHAFLPACVHSLLKGWQAKEVGFLADSFRLTTHDQQDNRGAGVYTVKPQVKWLLDRTWLEATGSARIPWKGLRRLRLLLDPWWPVMLTCRGTLT